MHPASMIILDIEEVLGDEDDDLLVHLRTDEMAFIPERREPTRSFFMNIFVNQIGWSV